MENKTGFSESQSSIIELSRKMDLRYKRFKVKRKLLMDRRDNAATQMNFLRTMHNICISGDIWPILYLRQNVG
jgi:hypothetical protein